VALTTAGGPGGGKHRTAVGVVPVSQDENGPELGGR
jgi:hypothetical protein